MGLLAYTVVNIIVTLKVAMLLHSWTWVNAFFVIISILLWFIVAYLSPLMIIAYFYDIEGAFHFWLTDEAANFWLFVVIVIVTCLVLDWAFKAFKRNFYPEPFHVVQSLNAAGYDKRPPVRTVEGLGTPLTTRGTPAK